MASPAAVLETDSGALFFAVNRCRRTRDRCQKKLAARRAEAAWALRTGGRKWRRLDDAGRVKVDVKNCGMLKDRLQCLRRRKSSWTEGVSIQGLLLHRFK